jgi:predicted nuclease of predicted toxin-antitoxin system
MNLLADEGVEQQIVERLRRDRHDVLYVAELDPGVPDDVVLRRANAEGRLLRTGDKDFGELVFRQRLVHGGIVLVRLSGLSPATKAATVSDAFARCGAQMPGSFSVISPGMVRVRTFPDPEEPG